MFESKISMPVIFKIDRNIIDCDAANINGRNAIPKCSSCKIRQIVNQLGFRTARDFVESKGWSNAYNDCYLVYQWYNTQVILEKWSKSICE